MSSNDAHEHPQVKVSHQKCGKYLNAAKGEELFGN